jgi:hypothetical protein
MHDELEGSGGSQIEMLFRHLPGGTEETTTNLKSGWAVTWPKFEPSTSRMKVQTVTALPTSSVIIKIVHFNRI